MAGNGSVVSDRVVIAVFIREIIDDLIELVFPQSHVLDSADLALDDTPEPPADDAGDKLRRHFYDRIGFGIKKQTMTGACVDKQLGLQPGAVIEIDGCN